MPDRDVRLMRPGTVDEAPALTTSKRASIVADAAIEARRKLEQAYGRKGDLQTLARLANVSSDALVWLYDAIVRAR